MQFFSENRPRTSETVSLLAFNMYYSYATEFFAHGTNVYMCTRVHPHVHAHVRSYPSNSRIIAFVIVEMDEGGDRRGGKPRTIKTLSEKKKTATAEEFALQAKNDSGQCDNTRCRGHQEDR